jgi:hypothetical protein
MFTIFALALSVIASAGSIACGVGVLATAPLAFLGHALAYRDLVGIPGAQWQEPGQGQYTPPPAPDYRPYAPSTPPVAPSWATPTEVSMPVTAPPVAPPAPEPANKICPHCGATLARVVNFCNQCGRSLRDA